MDDPLGFTARRPAYACKPVSAHRIRAEEPAERQENYGGEPQESIDHCLTCKLKPETCTGEGGCTRERRRGRPRNTKPDPCLNCYTKRIGLCASGSCKTKSAWDNERK